METIFGFSLLILSPMHGFFPFADYSTLEACKLAAAAVSAPVAPNLSHEQRPTAYCIMYERPQMPEEPTGAPA